MVIRVSSKRPRRLNSEPDRNQRRPAPAVPALKVSGLSKRYGERPVIDGLEISVQAGQALALMGPNGCGKSTVLRCLSGHETAQVQAVEVNGSPATIHSADYRSQVFPIFDDFAFFPDIMVKEHLEFLATVHGRPEASASTALAEFGMTSVSGQFPSTLSSGQIRRVAFAAAVVRPWSLLLLDEPEQRLDDEGRASLVRFLLRSLKEERAVVLATHDHALVEALGAQVLRLEAA